ncbi:hypothetical protein CEB3_c34620 [Peptococcaceae bacterium CEB3]|nr:hypothetical protein CEB3_c34620 [Peptococcaceae bacterium CEB3]
MAGHPLIGVKGRVREVLWLTTGQATLAWPSGLSPSTLRLFEEYLRRSEELRAARRREGTLMFLLVLTGAAAFTSPWLGVNPAFSLLCAAGAFLVFRYYLKASRRVNHVFINLNVLHHHLLGKLEVGSCRHGESCDCINEFRRLVWQRYHISLYEESLTPG